MRDRIVVVKSDPFSAVGFPDFLEDKCQSNDCVPIRIDMYSFFPKNQAIICCLRSGFTHKTTIHHVPRCHKTVSKHRDLII